MLGIAFLSGFFQTEFTMRKPVRGDTPLAEVGERGLLDILSPYVASAGGEVVEGFGDDAAVVNYAGAAKLCEVLTTDMLVEGTHFLRNADTDWVRLGRRSVAANVSDIASMGAVPKFILIGLGVPGDIRVGDLQSLYAGMADEARRHGALLVGGDTVRSPVLVISISLTGTKGTGEPLPLRKRCRAGQEVYVSGHLGSSRAGMELLTIPSLAARGEAPWARALLDRHLSPDPRVSLGRALAASFSDLAMIDISDSLANELRLLSESSRVEFHIRVDRVPVLPELVEFCRSQGIEPRQYALFSGEEYELLFCTSAGQDKVQAALNRSGVTVPVTHIGRVVEGRRVLFVADDGTPVNLPDSTFRHFPA